MVRGKGLCGKGAQCGRALPSFALGRGTECYMSGALCAAAMF